MHIIGWLLTRLAAHRGPAWPCAGCIFTHLTQELTSHPVRAPQFVADGVFYAELNELLTRELAEHGYSGVEVRVTPLRTEIIIRATRTQNVLGERFDPQQAASSPCTLCQMSEDAGLHSIQMADGC